MHWLGFRLNGHMWKPSNLEDPIFSPDWLIKCNVTHFWTSRWRRLILRCGLARLVAQVYCCHSVTMWYTGSIKWRNEINVVSLLPSRIATQILELLYGDTSALGAGRDVLENAILFGYQGWWPLTDFFRASLSTPSLKLFKQAYLEVLASTVLSTVLWVVTANLDSYLGPHLKLRFLTTAFLGLQEKHPTVPSGMVKLPTVGRPTELNTNPVEQTVVQWDGISADPAVISIWSFSSPGVLKLSCHLLGANGTCSPSTPGSYPWTRGATRSCGLVLQGTF